MSEEGEQRYSDHLSPHINDLSLNETKLQHFNLSNSMKEQSLAVSMYIKSQNKVHNFL